MANQLTLGSVIGGKGPATPAGPVSYNKQGYGFVDPNSAGAGMKIIPTSLAQGGAQLYSPSIAATLAGTQYNQAITDAKQNLAMTQAGAAQALSNVQNWWQAILGGQQQAAGQDASQTNAVENAEAGNNASILASLGGSANPAASSVAVAGQNAQAILGGLGLNNEHFDNQMGSILQHSAAGAQTQQQDANQVNVAKAMQGVNDQVAAKGAAQAQDQWQILQANNQIMDNRTGRQIDIMGQNNQTRGQIASNRNTIVGNNNSVLSNLAQMAEQKKNDAHSYAINLGQLTEQQKSDARNYAINLRQLNDTEKQTKVGVLLATAGVDPKTGGLTMATATQVGKLVGVDPKSLLGVPPKLASATILANAKAAAAATAAGIKANQVDDTQSAKRGFLVGKDGNILPGKDGKPILWQGFQYDPKSPSGVSQIPAGQPGSTLKGPTPTTDAQAAKLQSTVDTTVTSWLTGHDQKNTVNRGTNAQGVVQTGTEIAHGVGKLTYPQMQQNIDAMTDPKLKAMYQNEIDTKVPQGTNERPYTDPKAAFTKAAQLVTALKGRGMGYEDAYNHILKTAGLYFPGPMSQVVATAVAQVYHLDPNVSSSLASGPGSVPRHTGAGAPPGTPSATAPAGSAGGAAGSSPFTLPSPNKSPFVIPNPNVNPFATR